MGAYTLALKIACLFFKRTLSWAVAAALGGCLLIPYGLLLVFDFTFVVSDKAVYGFLALVALIMPWGGIRDVHK
jgi:hypothetical protein